jgi:hypothetical protein
MIPDNMPECVREEALDLFFGAKLGSGQFRDVYVYAPDTSKVIKIERGSRCFSNVME